MLKQYHFWRHCLREIMPIKVDKTLSERANIGYLHKCYVTIMVPLLLSTTFSTMLSVAQND